jgi:hypothetical protein
MKVVATGLLLMVAVAFPAFIFWNLDALADYLIDYHRRTFGAEYDRGFVRFLLMVVAFGLAALVVLKALEKV